MALLAFQALRADKPEITTSCLQWESIRANRLAFYEPLQLSSLKDILDSNPGAAVTRLVVLTGWGTPACSSFTLIDGADPVGRKLIFEYGYVPSVHLRRLVIRQGQEGFQTAADFMRAIDKRLEWQKSKSEVGMGDDIPSILFEHASGSSAGFIALEVQNLTPEVRSHVDVCQKLSKELSELMDAASQRE